MDATETNIHGSIKTHLETALASHGAGVPMNVFAIALAVANGTNDLDATAEAFNVTPGITKKTLLKKVNECLKHPNITVNAIELP
jgi:hypothetical protein